MKLARRTAPDTRQLRADQMRRDRAASAALKIALPAVQLLRLELRFEGPGIPPAAQSHVLHPPARAFFSFPCPYADCDGHFDLDAAVQASLTDPRHHTHGELQCDGARTCNQSLRQPCQLQLHYSVTATCEGDESPADPRRVV